jgi:peptidoglycan hydrolase-like protein with peptidoglycan-binding domain
MRPVGGIGALALIVVLTLPAPAAGGTAGVAALQAALRAQGLYGGFVDGVRGPLTRSGILAFQRSHDLAVDGIAGPQTRSALGWRGRPALGSRAMRRGDRGWDVAALQFLLQRAGRGPGTADGIFGGLTAAAVLRAQRAAGIAVDGLVGPATIGALRGGGGNAGIPTGPVAFLRPVAGPIGDGFGAGRGHQGIDFPVAYGTRIGAAGYGTTIFAGYNYGGYGNLVVVQHRLGYTTWYAHLSRITTWVGERVVGGTRIGYVGSTGNSTGPHLHFEVRRYNTWIDPVPQLLNAVAATRRGRPGRARGNRLRATECARGTARRGSSRRPPRGASWIARERLC